MPVPLPDSPDGYASDPWGLYVRVDAGTLKIRCTDDVGGYRIVAETPEDLLGPVNTSATATPSNDIICDRTGFKASVSDGLKEEWNGGQVRSKSWEPRHQLDFARPVATERSRGSPRPEPPDVFRETPVTLDDLDP